MIALFKQMVLSVAAAAIFGSVILTLAEGRAQKEILRIAVGILLILSLLNPLRVMKMPSFSMREFFRNFTQMNTVSENGYLTATLDEFCAESEQYICDKGEQDGIPCTAQISAEMQENSIVISQITITFTSEPNQDIAEKFCKEIAAEFAISDECVIWS